MWTEPPPIDCMVVVCEWLPLNLNLIQSGAQSQPLFLWVVIVSKEKTPLAVVLSNCWLAVSAWPVKAVLVVAIE